PDLIAANALQPGAILTPRSKSLAGRTGTVLADGTIEIEGQVFDSPSIAATHLTGGPVNGWWFFLVSVSPRKSLAALRREYLDTLDKDDDDDEDEDDADEEE